MGRKKRRMSLEASEHRATRALAEFTAGLRYEALPEPVVARTEELFLDWVAATLAARGQHPIPAFERFVATMGPSGGSAELLGGRGRSSAYFAAWLNAAASHTVEQDDLHNGSVLHPGTVVFPPALAAVQDRGGSGRDLITAAVAGYEVGIRVGEYLGRSHYRVFHTTATAGTLAAAAAVARVLGLDERRTLYALGSAGTQAAGVWEFLRDAADSKQLHTAHAAAAGLASAYLAGDGVTGAQRILEGRQGLGIALSKDVDVDRLTHGLGRRWALLETSFKFHASCRHTHPAADALLGLMQRERLGHAEIRSVVAHVHQSAIDVLGAVGTPSSVHQAKFSMGTVLGLIAVHGAAGLEEFRDHALSDPRVRQFAERVRMVLSPEVEAAYPGRWLGRIELTTEDGRVLYGATDAPKGDPDNTLERAALEDKLHRLARFSGAASASEIDALIARLWRLHATPRITALLP
jgi:2-methylcitrate dehydratase PrpD